ncbi:MAG: acyltransferase [Planctomycetota bacterium]
MTANITPPQPTAYYRQLDGIRALAVLGVMAGHWTGITQTLGFSLGSLGVDVFFVLSGFLITQILLRARDKTDAPDTPDAPPHATRGGVLKAFYARRALRIFPIYYVTIILGAIAGWGVMRENFFYHAAYLSNVRMSMEGDWLPLTAHFWSLSVEEQYYLFWPLLVLFLPRRALLPTTIGLIALAPLYRVSMASMGTNVADMAGDVMTPACLDCLCGGALLAYVASRRGLDAVCSSVTLRVAGAIGLVVFLVFSIAEFDGDWWAKPLLVRTGAAVFGVGLIAWAVKGIAGPVGALLSCRPMVYLGRISYGLYVLHNFSPRITAPLLELSGARDLGLTGPAYALTSVVLSLIITIALASLSWYVMELPLNKLKRHFPYTPKTLAPAADRA